MIVVAVRLRFPPNIFVTAWWVTFTQMPTWSGGPPDPAHAFCAVPSHPGPSFVGAPEAGMKLFADGIQLYPRHDEQLVNGGVAPVAPTL
jgi:hypothetical protein